MNFKQYDGKLEFVDLQTEQKDGRRHYLTPEGNRYPSITTVLGSNPDKKKGLMEWRKKIGEKEAAKITAQSARRGTNVHLMCEDYLNNKEDYLKKHMPSNVVMFKSIQPFLDEHVKEVYAQECPLYSDYLGVAGRTDCIGIWKDRLAVIDFKTARKYKKPEWIQDYFQQCAAYAIMFEERTKIPVADTVIVMAVENSKPQIFEQKRDAHVRGLMDQIEEYKNANPN
jgi:CRISPR/Cas system-associated exonuclease Cas4 (RecB family)